MTILRGGASGTRHGSAAVPTLTAAAVVTDRIRLGTLVASPNFRHPVPFARELISLDDISAGRLTLGIGSGAEGWDTTILGHEPWRSAEAAERFEEFVDVLDRLLREPEVSVDGRYYKAVEARTYPGCVQQPRIPFAVAATGPRSMRLAARHASVWVTNGDRSHTGPPFGPDEGAGLVRRQSLALRGSVHRRTARSSVDRPARSDGTTTRCGPPVTAGLRRTEGRILGDRHDRPRHSLASRRRAVRR